MSELIRRCFMINHYVGRGTHEDPCRIVRVFVDAETLEELCRWDEIEQYNLRRKAQKADEA